MSEHSGKQVWIDLTVPNAEAVRDFYSEVVGWKHEALSMGDYDDFVMTSPDGEFSTGICHARGENASIPAMWLVYITVDSVPESAAKCVALGGTVVNGPRLVGDKNFCIIRDPAGACIGLIES